MNHFLTWGNVWRKKSVSRSFFSKSLLFLSLGVLMHACTADIPEGVIPEQKMEKLLYDYHIAQAMAEARTDSVNHYRYLYVRSVFDKYGVCESEFDSSMVWYSSNASYLADMYVRINDRYTAELKALGSNVSQVDVFQSLDASGDTANVWQNTAFCLLHPKELDNRFTFALQTDTSFYPGDDLLWRFDNFYVYQDGFREAIAALVLHFDNDSVASFYERISQNQTTTLSVRTKGQERIKKVSGFIYLAIPDDGAKESFRMMLVRNFKLIRIHEKDAHAVSTDSLLLPKNSLSQPQQKSVADSAVVDTSARSVASESSASERISPKELRDNHKGDRTIHVVKEKSHRSSRRR